MPSHVKTETAVAQLDALAEHIDDRRLAAGGWDRQWQALIAILLSARTRDDVTIPAAEDLFARWPTLEELAGADRKDVEQAIGSVNFYKTKAERVQGVARQLVEEHGGRTPHDIDDLVSLPGVGRKTANVFLTSIGEDAVGVDTHVRRIANDLGWTDQDNADRIEEDLRALFPRERWSDINPVLVRFGQGHTRAEEKAILSELPGV